MMELSKVIIAPAVSGYYAIGDYSNIQMKYRWWRPESLLYHPYALVSFGTYKQSPSMPFKWREVAMAEDAFILGDSGGFQAIERGMRFNVSEIVEWYNANVDVGVAFDVILQGTVKRTSSGEWLRGENVFSNSGSRDYKLFLKSAGVTAENTRKMVEAMKEKGANFEFYPVLHGANRWELDRWWEEAVEPFLDYASGVASAPKPPGSPVMAAIQLAYLWKRGVKRYHMFAVNGMGPLAVLVYWEDRFDRITVDSASLTKAPGKGGKILIPGTLTYIDFGKAMLREFGGGRGDVELTCRCPACQSSFGGDMRQMVGLNTVELYLVSALHNLFWMLTAVDRLEWYRYSGSFKSLFRQMTQVKTSLDFLDEVDRAGFEEAYGKFFGGGLDGWL